MPFKYPVSTTCTAQMRATNPCASAGNLTWYLQHTRQALCVGRQSGYALFTDVSRLDNEWNFGGEFSLLGDLPTASEVATLVLDFRIFVRPSGFSYIGLDFVFFFIRPSTRSTLLLMLSCFFSTCYSHAQVLRTTFIQEFNIICCPFPLPVRDS